MAQNSDIYRYMISNEHVKQKAILLRKKGMSLDDIADHLSLSKTTVYYWIKDIPLTRDKRSPIVRKRKPRSNSNTGYFKQLRDKAYDQGVLEYNSLIVDNCFRDFILVYLTEGTRKCRNLVAVCNSNHNMITLCAYWIRKLTTNKITYWVQIHDDQKAEEIKYFWSNVLNVEQDSIKISRKSNSGKLNGRSWRSVNGVLSIRVNDTYLRSRIQAWMDLIEKEWLEYVKIP